MKKLLVALAVAAFATTASATIAGGPHDMTQAPYNGNKGTCQYCHAPHLWVSSNIPVGAGQAPLWNRNQNAAITSYGTTVLGTVVGAPGARSRTCLSCHDGTQNVGAVNNGISESLAPVPANHVVGTDLTNDHPVGVSIPVNSQYQNPPGASGIILASTTVECASCHEPHSNATSFLRATGAQICSACHLK